MEDKKKLSPISLGNKKYLVFEGGGGKGNAYLGVLQALEEAKILPLHKHEIDEVKQIKGVAGASAGAITALTVALGLTSEDIEFESDRTLNGNYLFNKKGFEFFDFFKEDKPLTGLYRGIKIRKGIESDQQVIELGYAYDKIHKDDIYDKSAREIENTLLQNYNLKPEDLDDLDRKSFKQLKSKKIDVGAGFNLREIEKPDAFVKALYKYEYQLFIKTAGALIKRKLRNTLKDDPTNTMVRKIYEKFDDYIYNILYDRGLFTGTMNREYFYNLIERYFEKYHLTNYELFGKIKGHAVTFQLFFNITGVDLRISGTNMTAGENLIFSIETTPHFPVAEAVAISMNIPGLFKPIHIHNEISERPLTGLWVDGGLLNNLPFQAFENKEGFSREQILGFNITEGPDPIIFQEYNNDPWFLANPTYKQFVIEHIKKTKSLPTRKVPTKKGLINPVKPSALMGTTLFSILGYLLNTWLDDASESQLPEDAHEKNVITIYSFHIGTLDFTPNKSLLKFVVDQAKKRTKERLTIVE
ncbi:MAG: patatin-like phospholipase family protein [Crocinitomicaceae bacterium]|nr:patatin-like phospholipase family protein [Crocinitomicaceae bacterium]MBK8924982.1 patatin-like phospholipase family protein [Crocinitomicaceae bacterium]